MRVPWQSATSVVLDTAMVLCTLFAKTVTFGGLVISAAPLVHVMKNEMLEQVFRTMNNV